MGVSLDGVCFSYSSFARLREELAELEGIDLAGMYGFGGGRSWDAVSTPLRPLLDHSDCDGEMSVQECAQVAPRLRELVPQLSVDFQQNVTVLASVMSERGEPLEFR